MPTKSDYLYARHKAVLTLDQVSADWGSGSHCATRLDLANTAFDIYYRAMRNIQAVQDPTHRSRMQDKLIAARQSGFGWGVNDLEEAFEHLADNNGTWSDDNTKTYFGGRRKCIARSLISQSPEAMVNFLNEVDDGMNEMSKVMEEFGEQAELIKRGQRRDDWATIGTALGRVKTGTELAKPWMWTAPATQQWAGRVVSFTDVAGKIHSGATMYTRSRQAGFTSREAAALTAMQTAVGFVPVLGSFYSKAVEMIPGLVTWYRGLIENRVRQIDRAARGY